MGRGRQRHVYHHRQSTHFNRDAAAIAHPYPITDDWSLANTHRDTHANQHRYCDRQQYADDYPDANDHSDANHYADSNDHPDSTTNGYALAHAYQPSNDHPTAIVLLLHPLVGGICAASQPDRVLWDGFRVGARREHSTKQPLYLHNETNGAGIAAKWAGCMEEITAS